MVGSKGEKDMAWAAVVFVIAAALAFAAAWQPGISTLWRIFLGLAALVFALLAITLLVNGLRELGLRREYELAKIAERQTLSDPVVAQLEKQRELLTQLSTAPETVLKVLMINPAIAKALIGAGMPVLSIITQQGEVPYYVLDRWLQVNEKRYPELRPVSKWENTGGMRTYISWLTNHLIQFDYLEENGGPNQARWADADAPARVVRDFYGEVIRRRYVVEDNGAEPDIPQVVTV